MVTGNRFLPQHNLSPPFSTRGTWHKRMPFSSTAPTVNLGVARRNPEVGGLTGHEAKAMINQRCGELPLCHWSLPGTTTYNILLMDKIRLTTKDQDYPIIYRLLTIPGGAGFRPSTVALFAPWNLAPNLDWMAFKAGFVSDVCNKSSHHGSTIWTVKNREEESPSSFWKDSRTAI